MGCGQKKVKVEMKGKTFNRLTVKKRGDDINYGNFKMDMWYCDCSCGTKDILVNGNSIRKGRTRSCGCYRNELIRKSVVSRGVYSKSGVTGVTWNKRANKWLARIHVNGTRITLGSFENKEDAIAARKAAEIKYGYC